TKIVQPLRTLTSYAHTLAGGPVTDAGVMAGRGLASVSRRPDEVGQLAQAFSFMVGQVAAREMELRSAQRELESRVIERTAELTRANEHLEKEIAERKRAEEELRLKNEALHFLNDLVEQAIQPFVVIDLEGKLIRFNPAFERLTGYSGDELSTMAYVELTPHPWHELERERVTRLMTTGQSQHYEKEY